jgi:iron-sulfur cluster assembly accessory protein
MSTNIASTTSLVTPVSFTEGAIAEINRLMAEPDFDQQQRLKVGVKGGGCSGMTYILGFEIPKVEDELFTFEGIPCCMEAAHQIYLYGMQIDWQGGLNSRGFTFNNPNASSTCGCGTSFAV